MKWVLSVEIRKITDRVELEMCTLWKIVEAVYGLFTNYTPSVTIPASIFTILKGQGKQMVHIVPVR